ncbi:MAG: winged helix-turn-helix transcriptional regulator [Alphaproteobacteria bacterium]|nr:winged helix-turn-helix transcriptional regulator [Alphaproteobacteria bacterium]
MSDEPPLNLSAFLPYQLSITSNAVSGVIAREYQARFGLKIPEWRIMAVLGERGELTQRDLVAATRMDKVTVNRAVKAMADRGLIDRLPDMRDGRSHGLALNLAGDALYREIVPAALAMDARLSGVLSAEEKILLSTLLHRMRQAADAVPGK